MGGSSLAFPRSASQGSLSRAWVAAMCTRRVAPILGDLAARIPVVLASRSLTGPVFTATYGYPGAEIDLIARGLVAAGYLSGLKARVLLGLCLRSARRGRTVVDAFAPYQ